MSSAHANAHAHALPAGSASAGAAVGGEGAAPGDAYLLLHGTLVVFVAAEFAWRAREAERLWARLLRISMETPPPPPNAQALAQAQAQAAMMAQQQAALAPAQAVRAAEAAAAAERAAAAALAWAPIELSGELRQCIEVGRGGSRAPSLSRARARSRDRARRRFPQGPLPAPTRSLGRFRAFACPAPLCRPRRA
jgi:hypothetical protein